MAISFIGAATVEATSITLPGTYGNGDVAVIFAFDSAGTTIPTLPSGWIDLSGAFSNGIGYELAYKILSSASDTSGTWTNATQLGCMIFRGQATNKTPIIYRGGSSSSSTNIIYPAVAALQCPGTSWMGAFGAILTLDTAIESPPPPMVNNSDLVGTTAEIVAHSTTGVISAWPVNTVSAGGTAGVYHTRQFEILAEQRNIGRNGGLRPHPFSPGLAR